VNKWVGGSGAIAALLLSSSALAQSSYISVAGGQGHQKIECSGLPTCDDTGTALKVVAGSGFAQGLALEVGYLDFGKVRAGGLGINTEIRVSALTLGGAFKANFTPDFAAHARLGLASVKAKARASNAFFSDSASETKSKPYYGLGLSYAVSKVVALEAGADFSKAELEGDKADVRALTVGARFTF
jgi:OmpA-OmpF porin, OOP family